MPPHLRAGVPVNQRLPTVPKALLFCDCSSCKLYTTIDPVTKKILRGQYVGKSELKQHKQLEQSSIQGASHYGAILDTDRGLAFNQISSPHSTVADPGTRSLHSEPIPPVPERPRDVPKQSLFPDAILSRLRSIDLALTRSPVQAMCANSSIVFSKPPRKNSKVMTEPVAEFLTLQDAVPSNANVTKHERWLESAKELVEELQARCLSQAELLDDLKMLGNRIDKELGALLDFKLSQWELQRSIVCNLPDEVKVVESSRYASSPFTLLHPLIVSCHLLVAFMHFICGVSLKKCKIMICALRLVLSLSASKSSDPAFHARHAMSKDPAKVLSFFDLEPVTKAFVCCPKCFQIYPYDPQHPSARYPTECSYTATKWSSPCGQSLRKTLASRKRQGKNSPPECEAPIRLYLYHELEDWIGSLYSRPNIKDYLKRKLPPKPSPEEPVWDILESPGLREFLGPEGDPQYPFLEPKGNEGRLIFSLNMDGFNPFSNKESGKKVSTGAIYLVCLNLPPSIRYDVENIFLAGIIPGPQEPSKDQINHLLRPLVDDLLDMWLHGFFLTSTTEHPYGLLVRGAVIPLVCDLPAARQMSGFASHSSNNFCSLCTLKAEDIANFDYQSWSSRSSDEHLRIATEWKTAPSEKRRAELYDYYGVRWSELLRLPYWDPTRFVVIDSMHAFFLRLFQRHVRQIWGMSVDAEDGDGPCVDILVKDLPSLEDMEAARQILRNGSETRLRELKVNVLRELSQATGALAHSGSKKTLVKHLLEYRIAQGWFDDDGNVLGDGTDVLPLNRAAFLKPKPAKKPASDTRQRRPVGDPPTPEEIETGLSMLEIEPKKKFHSMRKALLKHLCSLKGIDTLEKCSSSQLVDLLEKWRIAEGVVDSDGIPVKKRPEIKVKGSKVLGRETLKEVRADMERLSLPSWVSPAPRRPGVAKQGKFTADQWRSFCTLNLVFTLTRIWGSEPEGSRKRRMLDNYMHLVTAVKLASMRCMTPARIARYTFHMHQYLTTLLDLYPGTAIAPYQHLALHFQTFLERFGPTHAWRCFPFERYNFLLQNIPTNSKFGDLEQTIFKKFCMGQNLRLIAQPTQLPCELNQLVTEWEKAYKTDIRGTLRGDTFTFDENFREIDERMTWTTNQNKAISDEWFLNLQHWARLHDHHTDPSSLSPTAFLRQHITRLGEVYRTVQTSAADSNVYYADIDGTAAAGSIAGIFTHTRNLRDGTTRTQTFFVIKQYQPLSNNARCDSYRRFPDAAGKIYQDLYFRGITVIDSNQLLHHFARGSIEIPGIRTSCFVALPLDRS